ncbi:MAG: hypothetical protein JXQ71_16480 [Verrucomicrobia bacterium]|nr:hypothetical protein [Verrucomicrobiota bacterium]
MALLACATVLSALRGGFHGHSVDRYYHMAVIQVMQQAGGLPTWDVWEMNPGRRAHIYPVAFHGPGYLLALCGVPPAAFAGFLGWVLWPAALWTTWLWMLSVFGRRPALAAVILLSGSTAFFWNQTAFNAIAFAMALAPLALWALESERYLACAVLNLLAATAHPVALFLPGALVLNTLLRGKQRLAGLLGACLPLPVYGRWLAQLWMYRGPLQGRWNDNDLLWMGLDSGVSLDAGLLPILAACVGLIGVVLRRKEALGLLGPVVGSAIVFPMGFGGHILHYHTPWLLACLGGYGAGMLLDWLESKLSRGLPAMNHVVTGLAFLVLVAWVTLELRLPNTPGDPEEPPGAAASALPARPGGRVKPARPRESTPAPHAEPDRGAPRVRMRVGMSAWVKLLDAGSWMPPAGQMPHPLGALDPVHHKDAGEFFEAIRTQVAPHQTIYAPHKPVARLVTALTGRWTSGGILRNPRSPDARYRPDDCHFRIVIRGSPVEGPAPARSFEKVFGNAFGTLYRNPHALAPKPVPKAAVPLWSLAGLTALGIGLVLVDCRLARGRVRERRVATGLALVVAACCLARLAWTTAGAWLHRPAVTASHHRLQAAFPQLAERVDGHGESSLEARAVSVTMTPCTRQPSLFSR